MKYCPSELARTKKLIRPSDFFFIITFLEVIHVGDAISNYS